jgi:hypothetical protein
LGESGTTAGSRGLRGATVAAGLVLGALTLGLTACGSGERQDATEPSDNFPVQVPKESFPPRQLLANSTDLELAFKNAGTDTIPDLAVTIWTGKIKAGVKATGSGQGSFNIRVNDPSLAEPNRPVWILENDYPKLLGNGVTKKNVHAAPRASALAAQTDTFQFGAVPPGQAKDIIWHVTPVMAGNYTLHYVVAAGLQGKAKAVTPSGGKVRGQFHVTIASKPPETCVKAGRVVTKCGP